MKLSNFSKVFAVVLFSALAFGAVAYADHSWGSYHWARTSNPFNLKLGDNVSSAWDSHLVLSSSDWSLSSVLDTAVVAGQSNRNCRPTSGRVEVCSAKYGFNGWLGVASIWVSGSHIAQGTVKVNDTYFNTATYNTPEWRNLVMCQEIGHTFGLAHQDENFDNPPLGTCMDYARDPAPNQHPNQHDYDQLELIYSHPDSETTVKQDAPSPGRSAEALEGPSDWGRVLRRDSQGRPSLYVRDLGNGEKVFTFVIWAL